jgi:hypothetical protein
VENSAAVTSAWAASAAARSRMPAGRQRLRRRDAGERHEDEPDPLGLRLGEAGHGRDADHRGDREPAGAARRAASRRPAAIGRPSMTPQATGEPSTQNQYGRREATLLR